MDDAPCPSFPGLSTMTPQPIYDKNVDEKDKIMKDIKSFEVEFKEKKYKLELAKSENDKNIIFKLTEKKIRISSNFIAHINYNQFLNINSIFGFYSNIIEIYKLLLDNLNDKKYSLSQKNNNFILIFEFLMPGKKNVNVDFYLNEEKVNNTMIINDIYTIIDKLEHDNSNFKEEINKLKIEDKKMKEELDNKNEEILNVKHEMDEIKKENILIKENMKYLEEKLNNITRNNNIQYSKKDYYNGNIMENTIENYFDSKENSNKKEIECKKEIEKINNEQKNENKIINNQSECMSVPNNNLISKNNAQRNIIIDEDDDEEQKEKEKEENKEEKNENETFKKKKSKDNNEILNSNKNEINLDLPKKPKSSPIINLEDVDINNTFIESKIISTNKEKISLYSWLTSKGGHISEIKLIFQSSTDGDTYEKFIEKCGEQGPILSVIKSKRNKKFGGFSMVELTDKKGKIQLKDENAFVYSLDNLKKYDVLEADIAISCYPNEYVLIYGNNNDRYGLRIFAGFLENKNYENFAKKRYNTPNKFSLSGENSFYVDELEIFKIIFK